MKKEDKVVEMAYDDTMHFIVYGTDKWNKEKGSFLSYGLLNAVFEVLFSLAPSKESAMEIVDMSLSNFISDEEL